jgi:hypothetical protein
MSTLALLLAALLPQDKPLVVDAGKLTCEVHVSRTANLFHMFDQFSEWSIYCHRQYTRHFAGVDRNGFSDEDRAMLARHTTVRAARGWGAGLEQTFYSPLDLDAAIKLGLEKGHLDADQAKTVREVLAHFAPRIDKFVRGEKEKLDAFAAKLREHQPRLKEFADRASKLFGGEKRSVPVYLIANPADHDMGGGYNGERLTLEIPQKADPFPTLLHEVFHAFLHPRMKELAKAADGVKGLDAQTLNEGLAYAISPGLFHARGPNADPLRDQVKALKSQGKSLEDSYYRFNVFGLALRPFVREAMEKDGETFGRLVTRAVDAWRVVEELEGGPGEAKAGRNYRLDPLPSVFIFGSHQQIIADRFLALRDRHVFGRSHGAKEYDEMFKNHNKSGDWVVLLLDLSSNERVPEGYHDFLPKPWKEIEADLRKGESFELVRDARQMKILILAAPDRAGLEKLMRQAKLAR